jgi:hypothetical protein
MTDVSDGSGPIPRRTPRASDGGAPVGGAVAIVLAFIAVVAGFFILRSISGDSEDNAFDVRPTGDATQENPTGDDTGTTAPASTLTPAPTTTAAPALTTQGATVIVANASKIGGTASQMSRALEAAGFTMGEATNSAGIADALTASVVYFDPAQVGAEPVANSVAAALGGGVSVLALPVGTPPVESGSLDGAGVLLMLGTDKAGKTLADLNGGVTAAPLQVITNPPVVTSAPAG